ncbi:MAG: hypothetical protein JST20_10800 [Bacteroidetes bacterium]|nr:hypothetical protein [Bacteroidota bacterium]
MKTNLQLILIVTILLLIQGCKPQNAVAPPASDEVTSITFESTGWYNTKLICTRDSIWYINDGRIIPIDTAIADTQEFIPLISSFDVNTFWSLQDNVEKRRQDQSLFTITVTARQASSTNTITSIVEKKLLFTDIYSYSSLLNFWAKLDTLETHLKDKFR